MNVYTIRDQVAGFFIAPYLAENDGHACRMFVASLGDTFPHRADFSLHRIGSFDTDTGELTTCDPTMVMAGTSIDPRLDPRPPQPQQPQGVAQ